MTRRQHQFFAACSAASVAAALAILGCRAFDPPHHRVVAIVSISSLGPGTPIYKQAEFEINGVPYGFWLSLCGMMPLMWLMLYMIDAAKAKTNAADAGTICTTCGYDLRANTCRCSECGTPIREKVAT